MTECCLMEIVRGSAVRPGLYGRPQYWRLCLYLRFPHFRGARLCTCVEKAPGPLRRCSSAIVLSCVVLHQKYPLHGRYVHLILLLSLCESALMAFSCYLIVYRGLLFCLCRVVSVIFACLLMFSASGSEPSCWIVVWPVVVLLLLAVSIFIQRGFLLWFQFEITRNLLNLRSQQQKEDANSRLPGSPSVSDAGSGSWTRSWHTRNKK